jgi:hypothetical protein
MASVNSPYGFQLWRSDGAIGVVCQEVQIDTSITIYPGDPLVRKATTNYFTACATAAAKIVGFAQEGVTGAAGVRPKIRMIPALENYTFVAQCMLTVNFTAGLAGTNRGLRRSGTFFGVHAGVAVTSILSIIGLKPGSAWGTYAEVLCKVRGSGYTGQA